MTKLNFESNVLRPCFVVVPVVGSGRYDKNKRSFVDFKREKLKAFFHRWYEYKNITGGSLMIGGPPLGQISRLYAIVEYEDGQVCLVEPQDIIFVGTKQKMKDYDFGEVENGACR